MNNHVIGNIILERAFTAEESKIIAEKSGKVEATAIVQDLGVENRNGRIYELKDMKPEIEGDRVQKELIPTGNLVGEYGHPCTSDIARQSVVDPKLACVRFTKMWITGNEVHANYKGTNNEYGKAVNEDLLEGVLPSFSLRALGSVERGKDGKTYVRNLRYIAHDLVHFPSHKVAYTQGLISSKTESTALVESANLLRGGNENYNSKAVYESGIVIPVMNQQVVDYIKTESANVKNILNTFETLYESAVIVNGGKQVQLTLPGEGAMLVNLEQYIQDEIMNYCLK